MKAYSESHMAKGWRKAVLANWGNECAICGAVGDVHCHHIIKRSRLLTRWSWRNGIPLCFTCHRAVHDGNLKVQRRLHQLSPVEYLDYYNKWTSAQYFTNEGITKAEWYKKMYDENRLKYMETYRC